MDKDTGYEGAAARAASLRQRARRYRGLAAGTAAPATAGRYRRMAQALASEAAIETARAALLRTGTRRAEAQQEAERRSHEE